jgi:hypothetical protein
MYQNFDAAAPSPLGDLLFGHAGAEEASGVALDQQLILARLRVSDLLLLVLEIVRPKDLPDLNGVAILCRAALRSLDHLFLGRRFHQPIAAQHFLRFDERSVGRGGLAFGERHARNSSSVGPFGLLPSPDIGESGARARLAFRISREDALRSVATSMWQIAMTSIESCHAHLKWSGVCFPERTKQGSSHATSEGATDGGPRLAAMQDCIASQVLSAPAMDGFAAVKKKCAPRTLETRPVKDRPTLGAAAPSPLAVIPLQHS